jgi:hypothetical protein
MIRPPQRSVTRFFIPMIDVLTLLFCIFLLMPYVKTAEGQELPGPAAKATEPGDTAELRRQLDRVKHERDRLAAERDRSIRQQYVCVLEINKDNGKLYRRTPEPAEVASQADAAALIDRERRLAGGREVYFLIEYPRELTGFPEQRQIAAYERWFASVPFGFDNPRARASGGTR